MTERPELNMNTDSKVFKEFYYLKEELTDFCRECGLPVSGSKVELTNRIALFLESGVIIQSLKKAKKTTEITITENTVIEPNLVCSQKHRTFFISQIGKGFSFNAEFQKWLKNNSGKTYMDAVKAYKRIFEEKKFTKTKIGRQFEYNAYIRDFFADNKGKTLKEAIMCWNYKKSLPGIHRYEKEDLAAIMKD